MSITKTCDYCHRPARVVSGKMIYPTWRRLWGKPYWYCDNGHEPAYVGCHPGTKRPLGRLADSRLRLAKMRAHEAFDIIWRSRAMTRSGAYKWLSQQMGLPPHKTHIGMFDMAQCEQVVALCLQREIAAYV